MMSQNALSPFDPSEVLTTDRLDAYMDMGRPMLNNYIRYAKVGGGQHGEVYMCYRTDPKLPRDHPEHRIPVAMKSVRRDNPRAEQLKKLRQRRLPATAHTPLVDKLNTTEAKIRKEIAIMKKCRHPHVVRLYEVIDDRMRDKIYMVMEYLGGGEVKWRNDNNEPILTVEQTRRVMRDAVLGLEYLHYQGIIHRDIKPANLLWTDDRRQVKIGDFGVSHFSYAQRLAAAGKEGDKDPHDPMLLDDSDLTRRAGTPSFLAPEVVFEHTLDHTPSSGSSPIQAVGSSSTVASFRLRPQITKSIDVWALGVTLYCLLFGKTPFFADPSLPSSEWSLYNSICNNDWEPDETMGFDHIPTGGRHPPDDCSEGSLVISLLSQFLKKDVTRRITLGEVKRSPWLLRNLPEPQRWLEVTSPTYKINVSKAETSVAMSNVRFSWNWGAVRRIFSNLRPLHHPRLRQNSAKRRRRIEDNGRGPVMSDPNVEQRIKPPARRVAKPINNQANSRTPLIRSYERFPDSDPNAAREKVQQRSKSIDRWYASTGPKNTTPAIQIRTSGTRPRRESESPTSQGGTPVSLAGSDRPRARFSQLLTSLSHWRPSSGGVNSAKKGGSDAGSGSGSGSGDVNTPLSMLPRSYPASAKAFPLGWNGKEQAMRRSEEALRYHQQYSVHPSVRQHQQQQNRPPQYGYSYSYNQNSYYPPANVAGSGASSGPSNASGVLTAARRASSWGYEGFDSEYMDVVSLRSDRMELNEHEMIVGAGGVANDLQALMPRNPSSRMFTPTGTVVGQGAVTGVSQLYSASKAVVSPSSAARESGRVSFYEETERARYGPPAFDDSSTIASGSDIGSSSGEWQRGSGLFEEGEDKDGLEQANMEDGIKEEEDGKSGEEDGDDSDDDDNHVTFAPRRRVSLH